jgi:hypothetical protein
MAMIFTLVTVIKDSAELIITERQNAKQALADIEAAKLEEEENKKFQGDAVNRDTFIAWREKFMKEQEDEERRQVEEKEAEDKKSRVKKEEKKMTGRELWEKGLVGKADEDEEEEDSVDIEKLKIAS